MEGGRERERRREGGGNGLRHLSADSSEVKSATAAIYGIRRAISVVLKILVAT